MKNYWTWERAFDVLSEETKEVLFDLWVKGQLPLQEPELALLADWAYPPEPVEEIPS